MRVRASVKALCRNCKVIRRKGVVRVVKKTNATNKDKVNFYIVTLLRLQKIVII